MWNKKRVISVALGVSVTMTSVMPSFPAYAVGAEPEKASVRDLVDRTGIRHREKLATGSNADWKDETEIEDDDILDDDIIDEDEWMEDEELADDGNKKDWPKASDSNADFDDTVLDEELLATSSNAAYENETGTHLAVFTGELPETDVEWEDELSEDDFDKPYSTVTKKSADGETYKIEVVPKGVVYFVDSGADEESPAYDAVASIAELKNDAPDQEWSEGESWGYTGKDGVKGNTDVTNKDDTGFYGENPANNPVSYVFQLDAGVYKITSRHKDWWNMNRPMKFSVKFGDTVLDAGSVQSSGTNEFVFSLSEPQTVTYEINNTGNQGAIVSWVAVEEVDQENLATVTFNTGEGSAVDDMVVAIGGKLSAPEKPSREGFLFKGWYKDADGKEKWDFDTDIVEGDLTLYAVWSEATALDDLGLIEARTGAVMEPDLGDGEWLNITSDWISGGNSAGDGGGVITDAADFFKKEAFTWYTDFNFNSSHDNTSAFLAGNEKNHFRLIPRMKDGSAVLRVAADGKEKDYAVNAKLDAGKWHAAAVLYHEDDSQGYVELYVNGEKVLDETGLGFKLTDQESMIAGYGITYGTGFMRDGKYDNVVVADGLEDADTVEEETSARAKLKNSLNASRIVIDGEKVAEAAENMNGLTFKGFGVLDCNSTNALLLDYKAQQPEKYWEMLEILFGGERPIMQHIKIEMGNDKNNSTGSQACTMRTSDEYPDVSRVTGFQLAADAKKINPNVKVSLLYWRMPGWVGSNAKKDWSKLYKWLKNTTIAAYREYGYMVDIIAPGMNESKDDPELLKQFSKWIKNDTDGMLSSDPDAAGFHDGEEAELFHEIQLIMSDEVGIASCGSQMINDQELHDAVDIVGYHYNTDDDGQGSFTRLAEEFDKEIWNSEAQATFGSTADRPNNNMSDNADPGTGIGGSGSPLEMANTAIKGFVKSRRTHFVYQPTFGAFYEGTQYNYKDVMAARDPWSGFVNYDGALNVMQHFSKFAVTGWEYDTPDENVVWRAIPSASKSTATGVNPINGRNGGDNYLTLASPDGEDFSVVICNDSGRTKDFTIYPKDMKLSENAELHVWETRASEDGELYNANYMKNVETLKALADGTYTLTVKPWSIVTVTTLDMDGMEEELELPAATEDGRYVLDTDETGKVQDTADNYLYADDFDYDDMDNVLTYEGGSLVDSGVSFIESRGGEDGFYPLYTQDVNGTFEVVKGEDGNGVLRMNGQTGGSCWNNGEPATIIGDYRWTNYKVSVDFDLTSTDKHLLLGARQRGAAGGGDNKVSMSAYNIAMDRTGEWILRRHSAEIARGTVEVKNPRACNVAIKAAGDTITAYIEGNEVYTYTDPNPQLEGRIMLGVGLPGEGWNEGEFDNLKVETIPGYTPYFKMVHDNLHMDAWDGDKAGEQTLFYEGSWSHVNQKGSQYSQRSLSSTSSKGASVTYHFTGTGFALIGASNGSAKVDVDVDGNTIYSNMQTIKTESHQPYLVIRGLEDGDHMVTVTLLSGNLDVDSIAYIAADETVSSQVDVTALEAAIETSENLKEEDYDPDSWKTYQDALTEVSGSRWTTETVNKLLDDPVAYGADQETVNEIVEYYESLLDLLLRTDAPVEIISTNIPKLLSVPVGGELSQAAGGTLPAAVSVKKLDGTVDEAAEITWKLSGSTNTAFDTVYAVGTVTGGKNLTVSVPVEIVPAGLQYFIDAGTEDETVYNVYKAVNPELKNDTNDQLLTEGGWGRNEASAKADTNALDKLDTGIYNNGGTIQYTLPLEAGIYTLTAGFTEWWGYGRDMSQTVSWKLADGTEKSVTGSAVSFGEKEKATGEITFVLTEDAAVTYTLAKTKDQAPVISWLAVTEVGANEEAVWGPIFESSEKNQWDGLLTKGTVVTKQDPEQGEVIHMNAAGTTYIQLDPEKINFTGRENMTMSFNLRSETADGNFFTVAIGQDSNQYMFMRTREHETYTTITKGSYGAEQGASAQVDTLNKWVRVDLVFTPEQIVTYMDGVPVSTVNKTVLMTDLGKNPLAYLGKSFYSGDKYFAGAFDNIAVYNRARGAAEISLAYAVEQAEKLAESDYTAESWAAMAEALAAAKAVLADENAADAAAEAALESLQKAVGSLVEAGPEKPEVNKGALEAAVSEAKALHETDYTADSWDVLAKALAEAETVLVDENADQAAVDAAAEKLAAAADALVKAEQKPDPEPEPEPDVDTTELEAQIEAAESLNERAYTAATWSILEKALADAKAVLADEDADEETVDEAARALADAIDGLRRRRQTGGGSGGSSSASTSSGSTITAGTGSTATAPVKTTELNGNIPSAVISGTWSKAADNSWSLIKEDGARAVNEWAQIGGRWYLFGQDGKMVQGWAKVNNIWYYMDAVNGDARTGWQLVNGKWYYLNPSNNAMLTGWIQVDGKWYYMNPSGDMVTGSAQIEGVWYQFGSDGSMIG